MTSNGEDAGGTHQSSSAGDAAGGTDVVRELLLSLAANIDTIASMFAPPGHPAARPAAAAPGTTDAASGAAGLSPETAAFAGAPGAGERHGAQVPIGDYLAEASGEIAQLLVELGDLLARLLTALIAVLEAVVRALQSAQTQPQASARAHTAYAPISVRIDRGGRAGSPEEK